MAIFDRIRRSRATGDDATTTSLTPIAPHLLPDVNQRVTITMGEHVPVPSRVEDVTGGHVVLAFPALPLEFGDQVVVTWEQEGVWFSLDTRVLGVDERAAVPTVQVAAGGRLSRYDERRTDARRAIQLPIELRIVRARAIRPGRELRTHTVEVSVNALRFATSASFAPGDLVEGRIQLGASADDLVAARLRIIRVDAVSGSWRSTCTATFEEVLRSDRARLVALADASGAEIVEEEGSSDTATPLAAPATATTPPTEDGVGGRDEPTSLASMEAAVEWLRRRA